MTKLTAETLRELLDYDPATGVFRWKVSAGRATAGDLAGTKNGQAKHPYRHIKIAGERYYAHRLAWLYVHGVWPIDYIYHIDGNPLNNRISNLMEATRAEIHQNRHISSSNTSGFVGVCWVTRVRKWHAQIGYQGENHPLGFFDTPEEAYAAYLKAKATFHTSLPTPQETATNTKQRVVLT